MAFLPRKILSGDASNWIRPGLWKRWAIRSSLQPLTFGLEGTAPNGVSYTRSSGEYTPIRTAYSP